MWRMVTSSSGTPRSLTSHPRTPLRLQPGASCSAPRVLWQRKSGLTMQLAGSPPPAAPRSVTSHPRMPLRSMYSFASMHQYSSHDSRRQLEGFAQSTLPTEPQGSPQVVDVLVGGDGGHGVRLRAKVLDGGPLTERLHLRRQPLRQRLGLRVSAKDQSCLETQTQQQSQQLERLNLRRQRLRQRLGLCVGSWVSNLPHKPSKRNPCMHNWNRSTSNVSPSGRCLAWQKRPALVITRLCHTQCACDCVKYSSGWCNAPSARRAATACVW